MPQFDTDDLKKDTKVSYRNMIIISASCLVFGVLVGWYFF